MLFKAPLDFSTALWDVYKERFDLSSDKPEILVCDPKAPYLIDKLYLEMMPGLKIIATPSTGTNHIDLEACKERGIKVLSLLDDREELEKISASAEFTFKLLLDALRLPPALELQGKVIGLLGFGRIGRKLVRWCKAFGAWVVANDPHVKELKSYPLHKMFSQCDAVVVCCSLNEETKGLVTKELMARMKHGAVLVNTARGEIIDEDGLAELMQVRQDLRVALDVLQGETRGMQNPERLKRLGAIVTPHIAGETYDSRTKAAWIILKLLERETDE